MSICDGLMSFRHSLPVPDLEIISQRPVAPSAAPPLLFVHGAFCGAWVWQEHFLPWLAGQGFETYAVSLRGHGASGGYEHLADTHVFEYVADVLSVMERLPAAPVLIGHSMGGMVVQRAIESFDIKEFQIQRPVRGAVLMSSVPPGGLWGTSLHMMTHDPSLFLQIAALQNFGMSSLSPKTIHRAMFSPSEPIEETRVYLERLQPESVAVQSDMTLALPPLPVNGRSIPMLVVGASEDSFVPPWMAHLTASHYGAESHVLNGVGHAMMLGQSWNLAASLLRDWLWRTWPQE